MRKLKSFHFFFMILLSAMWACSSSAPSAPPTQVVDLNMVVAETAAAAMTQTAIFLPPPSTDSSTPEIIFTATETATQSPTPISFFTTTPSAVTIKVTVATNCRNGPGKVYGYEGALLIGETAEVFGRDPSGQYWYVRNPDSSGADYCWLWGKYATVTGNTSILPMYTPPPTPSPTFTPLPTLTGTPSPSFVVTYSGLDTCAGNWWVEVKVRNNGTIAFKSLDVVVRDTVTNITVENLVNGFKDNDGCNKTSTKDVLSSGDTYLLSAPTFNYDPTGHKVKLALILCSEVGQKGTCAKQNIEIDL